MYSRITKPRCFPGLVQRAVGYLAVCQFLGWCPSVADHGLLRVLESVVTTWHLRCQGEDKPQRKRTSGGRAGARHLRRVHQDSKTRFPLCVFAFVWGCHTESPANSLAGSSQRAAWGPGATDYHFWVGARSNFKSRSVAAAQRANYHVDDLGHCATRDWATTSDTRSLIFAKVSQYHHHQAWTPMTMKSGNS